MNKETSTKHLKKMTFITLILAILMQLLLPIFTNISYAATTETGLKYVIEDNKAYITGYNSKLGKKVQITETIKGKNVVGIRANSFKGNKKMITVTIPKTVTVIETKAFADCANLQSVSITGSNLKKINKQAFYNCTSLDHFVMPHSVTNLGESAFEGCSKLKTVVLSNSLTNIPIYCFDQCTNLSKITIPKGVTNIEKGAFDYCSKLKTVTFEKGSKLIAIGDAAFYGCKILNKMIEEGSKTSKDLELPDTVTQLGHLAFASTNFSTVIIPDKMSYISTALFQNCVNLEKVYYYYGTGNLGIQENAFYGCTKLKTVYAPIFGVCKDSFYNCINLEKIYVKSELSYCGPGAFGGCSKLAVCSKNSQPRVIQSGAKQNIVDTEAPKVKVKYSTTGATNQDVTVTIESTDGELLKPKEGWKISSGYKTLTKTYTSNENTSVNVEDMVGNTTKVDIKITNIDKTAPAIKISSTTGKKWKNKPQTVTVTAQDKNGIKSLKIQKVGSSKEYTIKGSKGKVSLSQYGQYKVVAVDKVGNKKTSSTFWNYVDTNKPNISNVKATSSGEVTAKVTDSTSEVKVKLSGNGKTYKEKTPDKQGNVKFSVAKTGKYTIIATDQAGNIKKSTVQVTIEEPEKDPAVPEDPVDSNEEENPEETPDDSTDPDQPINPIPDTEEDEISNGEEENEGNNKDEITEEGDDPSGEEPEKPIEINNDCEVDYDEADKTIEIKKYVGNQDIISVPETLEKDNITYTVTKIAEEAFKGTGIRKIEIPKTVTEIGANAFADCKYLEKVIIKNENTTIGNNAFTNNETGSKIYSKIDSKVEQWAKSNNLPTGIYLEDEEFEYIVVDETFQEITDNSTEEAEEVEATEVTVEDQIETVAEVIKYKGNNENVVIPSIVGEYKVSSIGEGILQGNTNIKQIELLENMRIIKTEAFKDCSNLSKVILRNKKISIGTDAFKNTNENIVFYCSNDSTGMDYAKTNHKNYMLIYGAFIYQLNEEEKTVTLLAASVGEGDPEYVTIEEDVGEYTLGGIKAGAFINTKLKGVVIKNKTVPIENIQIDPGALEGTEVGTLYCYEGSTTDQYIKEHSELGIKVAYLGENGEIHPEEIIVKEEEINIKVGETDSILAEVYPSITTNKEIKFKSNNPEIVTVDENGTIKGINEGETTIEVISEVDDSKVAIIKVNVDYIKLTLKLNGGELKMQDKTYTDQLEVKVPYDYKIKDITNPTRDGYEFKGWYEETEEENIALENSEEETITQDITLGATWEEIKPQASENGDTTIANKILPNTGKSTIIIEIVILIGIAIGIKIKIKEI